MFGASASSCVVVVAMIVGDQVARIAKDVNGIFAQRALPRRIAKLVHNVASQLRASPLVEDAVQNHLYANFTSAALAGKGGVGGIADVHLSSSVGAK